MRQSRLLGAHQKQEVGIWATSDDLGWIALSHLLGVINLVILVLVDMYESEYRDDKLR